MLIYYQMAEMDTQPNIVAYGWNNGFSHLICINYSTISNLLRKIKHEFSADWAKLALDDEGEKP